MTQLSNEGQDDSYEAVLIREDRHTRKVGLIFVVAVTLGMSSFLDVWPALFYCLPLFLCGVASQAWQAHRMIRTGYIARGREMVVGVWQMLAVTLILAVIVGVQMRFGLWFAQYFLDLYYVRP